MPKLFKPRVNYDDLLAGMIYAQSLGDHADAVWFRISKILETSDLSLEEQVNLLRLMVKECRTQLRLEQEDRR